MGSLEGVTATESGWIDSLEVVTVRFDAARLSRRALFEHAKEHGCTTRVWTTSDEQLKVARDVVGDKAVALGKTSIRAAKESDQVYYLRQSPLRFLPLTPLQARRVNGALHARTDPGIWLSPRQQALAKRIQSKLVADPKGLDDLDRPAELTKLDEYQKSVTVAVD
ncbi:MAG: hypothetical protein ACJAZN_000170 [Planctomycetota bacterium]